MEGVLPFTPRAAGQSVGRRANALAEQGKHQEAWDIFKAIRLDTMKELLPSNPALLPTMDVIAATMGAVGDRRGEREMRELAAEASRLVKGPGHSETLTRMHDWHYREFC
jgi:hypothetical protein